jgi:hypothetical protein
VHLHKGRECIIVENMNMVRRSIRCTCTSHGCRKESKSRYSLVQVVDLISNVKGMVDARARYRRFSTQPPRQASAWKVEKMPAYHANLLISFELDGPG